MRWIPVALAVCSLALAQPAPKFEVASIKPCKHAAEPAPGRKGGRGGSVDWSPGRLNAECQTVANLIRDAYLRFASGKPLPADPQTGVPLQPVSMRLMRQDLKGSPAWVNSDRYTIEAKSDTPSTREMMMGPMMQRLLEERFQLKMHRETREIPVYELTVAKGGPKLQAAKEGGCIHPDFSKGPPPLGPGHPEPCGFYRSNPNGGIDTHGQSMRGLCLQFSAWLDRDVVDKTGLSGAFDIHLDINPLDVMPELRRSNVGGDSIPPPGPSDPAGAIFAALTELGLKLEPAKAPGEFLVIDHIERPSEN